jgi:hypothetical protein
MRIRMVVRLVMILFLVVSFLPRAVWAQGTSGISGVVKDTTGAVLPGVTVEASSPVLIEKVRLVVTDDQGAYRIVNLVPGTYLVTFTLPGFSTVRREGIALTSNFTAAVDADLRVGSIEETVTVSGQSPIIDVENVVRQRVISREVLDALPRTRNSARSPRSPSVRCSRPINRTWVATRIPSWHSSRFTAAGPGMGGS